MHLVCPLTAAQRGPCGGIDVTPDTAVLNDRQGECGAQHSSRVLSSVDAPQSDAGPHHHKRNGQGRDAADGPGQAAEVLVGERGNQPQARMHGQGQRGRQQRQLGTDQCRDRALGGEQARNPGR